MHKHAPVLAGLLALLLLPSCSQKPADIKLNELNSVCDYMDALVSLSDQYIALVGDRLWADVSPEEQARLDEMENKLEDIGQACEKKYTRAEMKECPSYQKAIENHARMNEVVYGPNEEEEYIKRQQEESKGSAAAQQERLTGERLVSTITELEGHWVENAGECQDEGGLWIELEQAAVKLGGIEWNATVASAVVEGGGYSLSLNMVEEGEERAMNVHLRRDGDRLFINEAFRKYFGSNVTSPLVRCP